MGPMKKLFDLNKLPEETEMDELTEACQPRTIAGPGKLPGFGDAQEHGSTFDLSDGEMSETHAVPKLCGTIMRREPEVSLKESAYATSWLRHIGSTSTHPVATVQIDARQHCQPPRAMQVGRPAVDGSSNALLGIVGTPTALQFNQASRDLPAANLRRSNRRPARFPQPEIKAASSTTRCGRKSKSSEFLGVTFYKHTGRWEAHLWHDNEEVYLGASSTKESAARAYDKAALILAGPEAEINFKAEDYAEDIAMLGKLTKNQIVMYLRRESSCGGRKQANFPGVKGIRKNRAFLATYKQDGEEKSSQLLGLFGSEEDAAKAIYEDAVRGEDQSVAELILDTTRARYLPTSTGQRPAQESKCTHCAQKDQSNSKMQIRKRTPAICNLKLKLSQVPTFKPEAGQQSNSRSQQAPDYNNGQTSMRLRGWPGPAGPASTSHGPSAGKTLVARQRCELPFMPSQTSCNSFMPPPTNIGFRLRSAHISAPLQQPPSAAISSTNLRINGDNERRLHDMYHSWLVESILPWWYIAETFTSRYGLPRLPRT